MRSRTFLSSVPW